MDQQSSLKPGLWTQHVSPDGRIYYYNMAHGRSYWNIPDEWKSAVMMPLMDYKKDTTTEEIVSDNTKENPEEDKQLKEEIDSMIYTTMNSVSTSETMMDKHESPDMNNSSNNIFANDGSFLERFLQNNTEETIESRIENATKKIKNNQKNQLVNFQENKNKNGNDYLSMVRKLESLDKETDSTGGKWLVR